NGPRTKSAAARTPAAPVTHRGFRELAIPRSFGSLVSHRRLTKHIPRLFVSNATSTPIGLPRLSAFRDAGGGGSIASSGARNVLPVTPFRKAAVNEVAGIRLVHSARRNAARTRRTYE